ncbi:SDR family NAD(P)-dependent oxidoreductase [Bosea sp. 2YAB26]|uniref:SDR family NAD(P)-dependent oxidoreductase n=1 Tax=unclassified Bosea (in: a-proteobacteria) TaxID=2653178 RepID=UPI003F8E05E9
MELGLSGRTALVCGASKGIGKGIARALAREGVNVALLARGREALEEAADEIRKETSVTVTTVSADITQADSVASAAQTLRAVPGFSTLNILINNAGAPVTRNDRQVLWNDDEWRELIEVKTLGALRVIREFLPMMARDGTGRVINITGSSGIAVWRPAMLHGLNNSALIHTTGYLAQDLWNERITVNAIVPGLVGTEFREEWADGLAKQQGKTREQFLADFCRERGIFMERWAEVDEVADLALFIASDRARYINGAKLNIDGGFSVNAR